MAGKEVVGAVAKTLSRPAAMNTVHSRWEKWMTYVSVAAFATGAVLASIPLFTWEMKYRRFQRNFDSKATFQRQLEAGVFMSIRPDGTYRRYWNKMEPDDLAEMYAKGLGETEDDE